jgi:hypothetical protein
MLQTLILKILSSLNFSLQIEILCFCQLANVRIVWYPQIRHTHLFLYLYMFPAQDHFPFLLTQCTVTSGSNIIIRMWLIGSRTLLETHMNFYIFAITYIPNRKCFRCCRYYMQVSFQLFRCLPKCLLSLTSV